MKFRYTKFPFNPSPAFPTKISSLRPWLQTRIYDTNKKVCSPWFYALVDSGADFCLFQKSIGEFVGLSNITSGKKQELSGLGGSVVAYFHNIILEVGGYRHKCYAGFVDDSKLPINLLGQEGFFNLYEIKFDYSKKRFDLKKV